MLVHEQLKIHRVQLPMPFELEHINCYAIKGSSGWSVVDCGLNHEQCIAGWQEFMVANGIEPRDIKRIYVTHYHPDHFELAAWLQQLSGAPVFMGAEEVDAKERLRLGSEAGQVPELLLKNGIPPTLLAKMGDFLEPGWILEQEMPAVTTVQPGEKVLIGDFEYSVLLTPGHTDGQICFYNEEFGILFSGDHILPEISPNIGLWPGTSPNPLNDYFESLELCRDLYCNLVLSAHGDPFSNLAERIAALREIHNEKLDLIKSLAAKEATVYKVVLQIYGKTLNMLNLGLAMGEVYAHLMFLYYRGELELSEKEGKNYFSEVLEK